ncbi:MAG TPA: hypothetical protein PLQ93_01685 [Bacteroidia bacterium]|nr:hypothetical protein [Bacteroidia bacterium]
MTAKLSFPILILFSLLICCKPGRDKTMVAPTAQKTFTVPSLIAVSGAHLIKSEERNSTPHPRNLLHTALDEELKTIEQIHQIPPFLLAFLDSISPSHTFMLDQTLLSCISATEPALACKQSTFFTMGPLDTFNQKQVCIQKLPAQQVVYMGLGEHLALMAYYREENHDTEHFLILRFDKDHVVEYWFDSAKAAAKDRNSILDLLKSRELKPGKSA